MRSLAAVVIALAVTTDAAAYVRAVTTRGVPVSWPGSCAFVQPDSGGSVDLPSEMIFATVKKSIANWASTTSACSYLQLQYVEPAPLDAHPDGKNVVRFTTGIWGHPEDPQDHGVLYSSIATGITSIIYIDHGGKDDGTLIDTDIQLNDVNFTFVIEPSTATARPGTQISDLENTLTHELGHLLGLDHNCANSATSPLEVDQTGGKPPSCASIDSLPQAEHDAIFNATMYPVAMAGEIKKRMPSADDVAGVCATYPTSKDPKVCKPVNLNDYGGGCSMVGRAPRSISLALVILLALAALMTRRRG